MVLSLSPLIRFGTSTWTYEGRRAYVLVNNRSEGDVLLTVQALSEMLRT